MHTYYGGDTFDTNEEYVKAQNEHYLMVIYEDGTFEEINVFNF